MKKMMLAGAVCALGVAGFAQAHLTETFPDPLGSWTTNWLYLNSDMENYYVAAGDPNIDNRGNNPEGLWIAEPQGVGSGNFGPVLQIDFDPSFGAQITDISFGLEAFIQIDVTAYDMAGVSLGTMTFSGGDFGFDHSDIYSATSTNGVSYFIMDSTPYSGGQVSGNTSIDNVTVTIPSPATLAPLGLIGLAGIRRRR
jgi:hypothetical protein